VDLVQSLWAGEQNPDTACIIAIPDAWKFVCRRVFVQAPITNKHSKGTEFTTSVQISTDVSDGPLHGIEAH
jgi:hypothetical protein